MKKINNKGITLIELIVSFAIVGVAIIYFFQTLYTVKKLYTTARDETQDFVDKAYSLRIIDAYIEKLINDPKLALNVYCRDKENYCGSSESAYIAQFSPNPQTSSIENGVKKAHNETLEKTINNKYCSSDQCYLSLNYIPENNLLIVQIAPKGIKLYKIVKTKQESARALKTAGTDEPSGWWKVEFKN